MGLGGYLTWTAAAREICERMGSGTKVLPMEMHGQLVRPIRSEIFANNPRITQDLTNANNQYCIPLVLNNPSANYCKKDTPTKAFHRFDKHIIEQICETYGIPDPKLKCELYLTDEEESLAATIADGFPNGYVVIEPQSNDEYTVNKLYPLEKWQLVADELANLGISVVQVGRKTETQKLKGVSDLTGKTSFREAVAIIKNADLFMSTEGGLMHAATAVETRSVIVFTGFMHPNLTSYPENINIWARNDHGPCGMKIKCEKCWEGVNKHDPNEIINAAKEILKVQ